MKKTRSLLLCGVFVVALAGLTGCGGGDSKTDSSVPSAADSSPTTQSSPNAEQQKITAAGSGSNLAVTRKLAEEFTSKNPNIEIEVPPSIGSDGGIKSAGEGSIALGLVSRNIKDTEKKYGVEYKPYATVAAVFAVSGDVGVKDLTAQQICDIYSGKITNWKDVGGKDAPITVLTREEGDSGRKVFAEKLTGFKDVTESKNNQLKDSDQKMNNALNQTPNAIGWTDLGAVTATKMKVTVLNINGIEPTQANADSGKYPYLKELAFVYKGELKGAAKDFVDFVNSPEGAQIISETGYFTAK